jgi:hypothetical protein
LRAHPLAVVLFLLCVALSFAPRTWADTIGIGYAPGTPVFGPAKWTSDRAEEGRMASGPAGASVDPAATGIFQYLAFARSVNSAIFPGAGLLSAADDAGSLLAAGAGLAVPGFGELIHCCTLDANAGRVPPDPAPEPSTLTLLGIGICCLISFCWRRRGRRH